MLSKKLYVIVWNDKDTNEIKGELIDYRYGELPLCDIKYPDMCMPCVIPIIHDSSIKTNNK